MVQSVDAEVVLKMGYEEEEEDVEEEMRWGYLYFCAVLWGQ